MTLIRSTAIWLSLIENRSQFCVYFSKHCWCEVETQVGLVESAQAGEGPFPHSLLPCAYLALGSGQK